MFDSTYTGIYKVHLNEIDDRQELALTVKVEAHNNGCLARDGRHRRLPCNALGPSKLSIIGHGSIPGKAACSTYPLNGTFQFASLQNFADGTPFVYQVNQGRPIRSQPSIDPTTGTI